MIFNIIGQLANVRVETGVYCSFIHPDFNASTHMSSTSQHRYQALNG